MSGNFEALLAELNDEVATMAKALPADTGEDDEKIQAAAEGGEEGHEEPDGDEAEGAEGDGDEDDDAPKGKEKPMFGKSMSVTTEDGETVEAIDGTELVKSLMGQVEALETKFVGAEATLAKSLTDTLGVVKAQGELIKSLSAKVAKLSEQGRGRKSAVTVHEPPAMAKSMPAVEAPKPEELMAKALSAQKSGALSSIDVSRVENALNLGMFDVAAGIVARI